MQLTNTPGKLVLPFANAGAKNTIPTASQIGITAGAASLTDGFPPLTRTPIAAGGVPPSGLDMNGILFQLSAILRWANAGGGYAYDAAFATDSNVGGYPKGARIMRSDGLGYWFNTVENNTTDPEAAGAAAAGWVPDFTNGVTSVAMASANVTLTPLQYGKPIIVITGTLTANLNLIFPTIVNEWTVINNTTGPYTITCKTAAGTGLVVNTAALIVGDGTNIQSAVTDAAALFGETVATATGGTADAITATFAPVPRYPSNGVPLSVRATAANATTTPTFTPNSGVIAAATIVKGNNLPLVAGDIAGAGHWLELAWDSTLSKWVLLNPATGINNGTAGQVGYFAMTAAPSGWLKANGAAVSRTTYAALFAAISGGFSGQTFTVTIATPGVFTKTAHGFTGGERLRLSTTGALPTGLNTSTDYYVLYVDANTFQLATTFAGSAIATSGTQSGVHTYLQSYFGLGDGSTTFNLPDLRGEFPRGLDDGRGIDNFATGGRTLGTNEGATTIDNRTVNTNLTGNQGEISPLITNQDAQAALASLPYQISTSFSTSQAAQRYSMRPRNVALLACIKF